MKFFCERGRERFGGRDAEAEAEAEAASQERILGKQKKGSEVV